MALRESERRRCNRFYQDFSSSGRLLVKGDATITGMPKMLGMGYLQTTASAVLADGTALTQFYGYTADAPATGGCQPAHTWEKAYCYSIITLASTNSGLDWHSRAPIHWDGAVAGMPAMVEGPCEPSLVALPDGKTILSVFRLQSNKNLWMAKSTDGARSWETAQETNAWAVFPQVRRGCPRLARDDRRGTVMPKDLKIN